MRKKSSCAFLLVVPLIVCSVIPSILGLRGDQTIPSYGMIRYGWLHTDGRYIKDEAGNIVWLRGVARGELDYCFGSPYQGWYKHHEVERDYDRLKSLNVNIVRLALNAYYWNNHLTLPNRDGVTTEYSALVEDIVSWCAARNIYVLLEWHEYGDDIHSPLPFDKTVWLNWLKEIASRYANQPYVMIEPMNEPSGPKEDWRSLVVQAIEAIRAVNPNVVIFVQPSRQTWSPVAEFSGNLLPYPNIVYGFHTYYHSQLGSIVGHPWNPTKWAELYWNGQFEQAKLEYEAWLVEKAFRLMDEGVPVIVDEFGVWYPDQNWDVQIRDFYDLCRQYGVHFIQWWWHGCWGSEPSDGYATIDYHLLKFDWETLTVIGEKFVQYGMA